MKSTADFLAPPAQRIVVVQTMEQMQEMQVGQLPEGALISIAQFIPPGTDAFTSTLYRFTRAQPSSGSLVFGVGFNLLDANGDGFFYRYPQSGQAALVNGVLDITGIWLGFSPAPPLTTKHVCYVNTPINPGFLYWSVTSQVTLQVRSTDVTDSSTVNWAVWH